MPEAFEFEHVSIMICAPPTACHTACPALTALTDDCGCLFLTPSHPIQLAELSARIDPNRPARLCESHLTSGMAPSIGQSIEISPPLQLRESRRVSFFPIIAVPGLAGLRVGHHRRPN